MKDHATRIRRARARAEQADSRAADARLAYWTAIRDARADGLSLQAIANVLGVSRQRVDQLLKDAPG